MKKTWPIAIVIILIVVVLTARTTQRKAWKEKVTHSRPIGISLSAADISAAINYGKNHKDDLMVDFEKPWNVFLGYGSGKGSATIFTPYHFLALMARNSARDNSGMDTEVILRLYAQNYQDLYFEVTLYGDDEGFDRDYKAVVLKDGREIPVLKTFHQGNDQAREYTISSQKKLYFPADALQEKGKITLQIVKPKEASLDFVFDLKKIP